MIQSGKQLYLDGEYVGTMYVSITTGETYFIADKQFVDRIEVKI